MAGSVGDMSLAGTADIAAQITTHADLTASHGVAGRGKK